MHMPGIGEKSDEYSLIPDKNPLRKPPYHPHPYLTPHPFIPSPERRGPGTDAPYQRLSLAREREREPEGEGFSFPVS